jgi:hypothetical protein
VRGTGSSNPFPSSGESAANRECGQSSQRAAPVPRVELTVRKPHRGPKVSPFEMRTCEIGSFQMRMPEEGSFEICTREIG